MSQKDWESALNGLPIDLLSWADFGGDPAPDKWTGKIVGISENKQINEWILEIMIDGETKSREAAWSQIRPA